MNGLAKILLIALLVIVIVFGVNASKSMNVVNELKENIKDVDEIRGFTMEIYTDLTEIDNSTSKMDVEPSRIYKEFDGIRIVQEGNSMNVLYGNLTYVVNVEQKFYYTIEGFTRFPKYDLSDMLPKGIQIDESSWDLSRVLEITDEIFKGEECYAVKYAEVNDEYTTYISKKDGLCIGKCENIDGKKTYEYYIIDVDVEESDFTFDAIFGELDPVIQSVFERPYIQRDDGTIEYVNL